MVGNMSSQSPPRNNGPKFAPGKVNIVNITLPSILIAMQVPGLGLVSRVLGGHRALIHPRRESIVQHLTRIRLHNHRHVTFEVRTDSAVQKVESAFQLKPQPKQHLPYPTGLPKDISHAEILPLDLHGHPRTLLGVVQHQEN